MNTTDSNKLSSAVCASNVIPFPDRQAVHKQPEKAASRTFSLPLRQAVQKLKDAVLRLARRASTVRAQHKRGSTTAVAAHYAQHHQAQVQDHGDRVIRERLSA